MEDIKKMSMLVKDTDDRLIEGWASVEIKDLQGDFVPVEVMKRAMLKFMDRGGVLVYGHTNHVIGKILSFWIDNKDDDVKGIKIIAKIYKQDKFADEVWKKIKEGELKGFSIGGVVDDAVEKDDERILKNISLHEISVVSEPANPDAIIENYSVAKGEVKKDCRDKYMADEHNFKEMTCPDKEGEKSKFCGCVRFQMSCNGKSLDSAKRICGEIYREKYGGESEDIKDVEEIKKPFGAWKDFDDCVEYMMENEKYSEDVAKKVCGKLQEKLENKGFIRSLIKDIVLTEKFIYDDVYSKEGDNMSDEEKEKVDEEKVKDEEEDESEEKEGEANKGDDSVKDENSEGKMDILLQAIAELNDKMSKILELMNGITNIEPKEEDKDVEDKGKVVSKIESVDIVKVKSPEPPVEINEAKDDKREILRKVLSGEISPFDLKKRGE